MSSIAIILIHWRNGAEIERLSQKIHSWNNEQLKLCLIDNGDFIGKRNAFQQIISNQSNKGFSAACNQGIRWSIDQKIEYSCLLNADVEFTEITITQILNFLKENNKYFALSPTIEERKWRNSRWRH